MGFLEDFVEFVVYCFYDARHACVFSLDRSVVSVVIRSGFSHVMSR